ncbi:YqaJ viral recombinase family protein [Variovorax sp. H27-G14]|uniref:YqaJ viral recombinase family protein n=1 Tax=Variovorax sp. H27-G14 TaxID=3111914 RepID=UPI0038FD28AC
MDTLNLIQGSPEWHAHRASHFNASDAPAMLGCSPYQTRTQLLHKLATGQEPEVDAAQQKRFDYGHAFEAMARPLAEEFIGEELFPVVGAAGRLSASFDGLTMDESIGFEHKTLNKDLRAVMAGGCDGSALPPAYRAQMEQQLMISGAEKILFMASSWRGNELIDEMHCWYTSDPVMRDALVKGWALFAEELQTYTPAQVEAKPVGRTPETLPALHIEVTGMVTASNLAEFRVHALEVFGAINTELVTDQQFSDAEKTVKWCGDVEERLAAAKQHALSQTQSIDALFRTIEDISAEARRVRLDLNRKITVEKENRRNEIQQNGVKALAAHVAALNERLGRQYMPASAAQADFAGAMKGKKSMTSLREAVATTLANAKISASDIADGIQINMNTLRELASEHVFLFPDVAQLVLKASDDLAAQVKARIGEHQAKEAAKAAALREQIAVEERLKAEATVRAEQEEKRKADAAEDARVRAQVIEADNAAQSSITEAREAESVPTPLLDELSKSATAQRADVVSSIDARRAIVAAQQAAAAPLAAPTLRLGVLNERLAPIQITAGGLATLGFTQAARAGSTVLYHEADFPHICAALVDHVQRIQAKQAA